MPSSPPWLGLTAPATCRGPAANAAARTAIATRLLTNHFLLCTLPPISSSAAESPAPGGTLPPIGKRINYLMNPSAQPAGSCAIRPSGVRVGHLAVVERFVQHLVRDTTLPRNLPERFPRRGRGLHDLRRLVVPDARVQRGRCGQRELRVALGLLAVRLDACDALLVEEPRSAREQLDRLQQVARDQRDEDVQLEVALHA